MVQEIIADVLVILLAVAKVITGGVEAPPDHVRTVIE